MREVERSIEVAEAAGMPGAACRGYTNLGVLYHHARSVPGDGRSAGAASRWRDASATLASRHACSPILRSPACTFTDRCADEGVPAAEKAIELDRALDQREHLPVPLIVLGQIHQCNGRAGARDYASMAKRSTWPAKRASRSCCSPAMTALQRSISTSTIWPRPTAISIWLRARPLSFHVGVIGVSLSITV